MKRDLKKWAWDGMTHCDDRRQLTLDETFALLDLLRYDPLEAITMAFWIGAEAGYRSGQQKRITGRRAGATS